MVKQSIVLILILISMYLSGAAPERDDALVAHIMGPHHAVLVHEGKEAFIEKVYSTWCKEQVQPEELLDVLQKKVRQQARHLGCENHWVVVDMASCVHHLVDTKGEHGALAVLLCFVEYMVLWQTEAGEALQGAKNALGVGFGGEPEDFWELIETDLWLFSIKKDAYKQQGMMLRFVPDGVLPMAEFLALYTRGVVPMPLVDVSMMHSGGGLKMHQALRATTASFSAAHKQRECLTTQLTHWGMEKAWTDIRSASTESERLYSVFMQYQLHYEGLLNLLSKHPKISFEIRDEYTDCIRYFQQHRFFDKDNGIADEECKKRLLASVIEVLS